MKNEITVGKFLEMMKKSIWKDLSDKSSLYYHYFNRIEGLLHGLREDIVIKDLDSLEGLTGESAFDLFVRSSTAAELDKRFFAISTELGTWKRHMTDMVELHGQNTIRKKKVTIGMIVIILLLITALAGGVVLVATSLDDDGALNKIMGALLTSMDIVFGVAFFLYEFISDRKERDLNESVARARETGDENAAINKYNVYIGTQINKNKGNVINGNVTENHYHYDKHNQQ